MEIQETAKCTTTATNTEIVNHFSLPGNLQELSEDSQFPGLVEKTAALKNKNK